MRDWRLTRLRDVCSIDKQQASHSGLPYVGLEDIESNTAKFIGDLNEKEVKSSTFKFSPDHILYGRLRPYLNKVIAPNFIGHCSTEIFPIKPSQNILREFLLYWFLSEGIKRKIDETCTGARMPRANMDRVMEFEILVPPLPEQSRIVAILDEAFAGLETMRVNAEKNLLNVNEIIQSYIYSIFNEDLKKYKTVKLHELTTDITDGDHMPPPKSDSGIPFITISNINKETHTIDFSNTFQVPFEYFNKLKPNRRPQKGDVLYTVTGSYGIPVIVDGDESFCFQRHIGLVRPKPSIDSRWLYYLLLSPQVFAQADSGATGTAQRTVSLTVIRSLDVPELPLCRQYEVVTALQRAFELKAHLMHIIKGGEKVYH